MFLRLFIPVALLVVLASPAAAQEPQTRAELLRSQREEKSRQLSKPEPSGLARLLLDLESGRWTERLINRPEGIYPRIGNITAGSGISVGPGYRRPGLFGGHADLQTFVAASFSEYWMIDARLQMPRLAGERVSVDVHGQRYDFPTQEFFGVGPESRREDLVTYGLGNTLVGVTSAYRPARWLTVSGTIDRLAPRIEASADPGAILSLFDGRSAPGVLGQPDFLQYEAGVEFNYRQPRGNARRGGRYDVTVQRFDDLGGTGFAFNRAEVNLEQFIPLLRDRRVLALRALASVSNADAGAEVPFYLLRTLGGPDDLRGFRRFRFRDRNALLLQVEYRWEIFSAMDGALFYDAGKVAPRAGDLTLHDLESDYGIGFRFGSANGVFLRVEGAFGSSGGKHFILRFGDVF